MRLDKYLKISRLIKRRTVAKELADSGVVSINGKKAKPADELKLGDVIGLRLGRREIRARVISIPDKPGKGDDQPMYEIVLDQKSDD